ncbi:hypothetical protein DEJ36_11870 [Curtobacterium sp. MCPF17_052]|nr:hypothetical protein DEJ36_11870 [Curtobacterium sp. MCPF17_052]
MPCPSGSSFRGFGERDSGTKRNVSTTAAIPIGTLMRKIARHPTVSVSAPPTSGPTPIETPTTAPQTPTARARSFASSKVAVMMLIATGFIIDPPTAWTMRKTTSQPTLGASEHSSDPAVKSASPTWNVVRRPMRSAVEPESSSRLARTSV